MGGRIGCIDRVDDILPGLQTLGPNSVRSTPRLWDHLRVRFEHELAAGAGRPALLSRCVISGPCHRHTQRPHVTFPRVHHFSDGDPAARRMTVSVVSCPSDGRLDLIGGDPDATSILGSLHCSVASSRGGPFVASIPYRKYGQRDLPVDIALVYTGKTAMVLDWFNLTVA